MTAGENQLVWSGGSDHPLGRFSYFITSLRSHTYNVRVWGRSEVITPAIYRPRRMDYWKGSCIKPFVTPCIKPTRLGNNTSRIPHQSASKKMSELAFEMKWILYMFMNRIMECMNWTCAWNMVHILICILYFIWSSRYLATRHYHWYQRFRLDACANIHMTPIIFMLQAGS